MSNAIKNKTIKIIKDITKDFTKDIKLYEIKYFPEIKNIDKIVDLFNNNINKTYLFSIIIILNSD